MHARAHTHTLHLHIHLRVHTNLHLYEHVHTLNKFYKLIIHTCTRTHKLLYFPMNSSVPMYIKLSQLCPLHRWTVWFGPHQDPFEEQAEAQQTQIAFAVFLSVGYIWCIFVSVVVI